MEALRVTFGNTAAKDFFSCGAGSCVGSFLSLKALLTEGANDSRIARFSFKITKVLLLTLPTYPL